MKPTPILRGTGSEDLTTVLLVNKNGVGRLGDSYGRFLSVRPEIGLLTSTARTFIQEGVTTEYATQVVGTTLNNGRLYAQYLKKSSRVLFEKSPNSMLPSVVTSWVGDSVQSSQTRSYLQSHNDLLNADSPDWQEIDDRLVLEAVGVPLNGNDHEFIGNTDFIMLKSDSQLVSKPVASNSIIKNITDNSDVKFATRSRHMEDNVSNIAADKVLSIGDLPTFTVKNNFEPSGYQINEGQDTQIIADLNANPSEEGRSAKIYHNLGQNVKGDKTYHQPINIPKRQLSTVTYYGFADFTTLVGDSLIVFLPRSPQSSPSLGHVTSIKGMATLRTSDVNLVLTTMTTFIHSSKTAEVAVSPTTIEINASASFSDATEPPRSDMVEISIPKTSELMSEVSKLPTPTLDSITVQKVISDDIGTIESKPMFSLPTDQEILQIYSSLAKAQYQPAHLSLSSSEVIRESGVSRDQIGESNQVHEGATTIFIDDDPFASFVEPTSVKSNHLSITPPRPIATISTEQDETTTEVTSTGDSDTTSLEDEEKSYTLYSQISEDVTKTPPMIKEISSPNEAAEGNCAHITSQVFFTQLPNTDMILSTKNHENDKKELVPFDMQETTKFYCLEPTQIIESPQLEKPTTVLQESVQSSKSFISDAVGTKDALAESQTEATAPTVREESSIDAETATDVLIVAVDNVAESVNVNDNENDDYEGDNVSDEIDLIYKTLYTTYTYLTTFFQGQSTTVSSHTEIITNIVTSTLGNDENPVTINDIQSFSTETQTIDVRITSSPNIQATQTRYMIPDELESLLHFTANDEHSKTKKFDEQNTYLDDTKYTKTFYTTYTYYTTIFADTETDIMSRTEVFTNYVTELGGTTETIVDDIVPSTTPSAFYHGITLSVSEFQSDIPKVEDRKGTEISQNKEEHFTLVTDIRSSSSNGEQQVVGKNHDDDQVSSESNTEEIIPSATFLLQTSFTTFTFYTTMYVSDSTNVVSRLETVTNIATETLQPTKVLVSDEATLPITFFTTFTYWTKLAKDGEITTISREETISNVIEPTSRLALDVELGSSSTSISDLPSISNEGGQKNNNFSNNNLKNIPLNPKLDDKNFINLGTSEVSELTTFYTTYTYYTTSYDANKTVTDSRFETVTNVITPLISAISKTSTTSIEPTMIITQPQPIYISENNYENKNKDIIFYDYKHIIDADGISTLYFTTQVQSTVDNEGIPIEITSSTSSLYIDEVKKSNSPATEQTLESGSSRLYKTGLARLIEGTRIGNSTTTLYQSKVIGTIINNRYAQIIESTSSFIFEKRIPTATIQATSTSDEITTTQMVSLQSLLTEVEGSINTDSIEQSTSTDNIDDNTASLSQQAKKRTFAPVIRPFASRNRPTFAPKQKTLSPSSATIITRSDITPTITATPALKSVSRFSSSRRGPISNAPINTLDGGSTSSSRRLFGRPIKSSTNTAVGAGTSQSGSNFSLASTVFAPSRNRFVSSSRASLVSSSRRLSISSSLRPSSSINFRASALNVGTSRQRIRPASVIGQAYSATTSTLNQHNSDNVDGDEETSTEESTQGNADEEKNNQVSRRNQNSLLRFRRPLGRPSGFTPVPRANLATISPRRNPLTGRVKTSTTTTKTTTTTTARTRPRSFQRPTISSLQARARPQNNLFPPRGLFQQQKDQAQADKDASQNINDTESDSDYDDDDEGEDDDADGEVQNEARRRRSSNKTAATVSSISKLSRRRREADTLNRNKFRFRRPKTVTTEEPILLNSDERTLSTTHPHSVRPKMNSRFGSRYMGTHKPYTSTTAPAIASHRSIRPSRPTSPRTQFTLREQDAPTKSRQSGTSSNFRRQQSSARHTTTISSSTSASRRLKSYSKHNNNMENSGNRATNTARTRKGNTNVSARSRTTMRGRSRIEYNSDSQSTELGSVTITVTHLIPAEVTVPVVNGLVTEYKNIVTAKTSLEVLGPHQYTQILGSNGQLSLYLTREESAINSAGATELTRYLLRDSLTSTVTFTPTTIRGRRTSFSHVLPSTVYSVENLVSTVQPQIASNAPLANILLSQLLLGNINLPSNPLLGAIGQPQLLSPISVVEPSAPVTEYRTHTSTYVTTIYDGKSTILPITFQGKKILTTVFDTTAQTITATEYNVDTIVNTPSHQVVQASSQVAQVNNLLLQQLLLQQQQQQQQQAQMSQVMQTASSQILLSDNLQDLEDGVRFDGGSISARNNIDDIIAIDDQHIHTSKNRKKSRKSNKGQKRNKQQQSKSEEESSVVTLYVSGRRPGEFSTVLSTVYSSYDHLAPSSLHKRHINDQEETISLHNPDDIYAFGESEQVLSYVSPYQLGENSVNSDSDEYGCGTGNGCAWRDRTATLESIIGDVELWYATATKQNVQPIPSNTKEAFKNSNYSNSVNFLV
ncbi:PREDICTED: mucin-17-like [Drosophila arizonae]|uniref:Mucin-17-like n=1 Tax=Drosophila arizonae TaxID=7263 RepID=A0ABM1PPA5_DROAR|nr:PREDICTED: mucin-17-like [Drosophila arizonae]